MFYTLSVYMVNSYMDRPVSGNFVLSEWISDILHVYSYILLQLQ